MEVSEDSVEPAGEEDVGLFGVAGGASPLHTKLGIRLELVDCHSLVIRVLCGSYR